MTLMRCAARAFDAPLLMDARKAEAILAAFAPRLLGAPAVLANPAGAVDHVAFAGGRPSLGRLGDGLGRAFDARGVVPFDVIDNVAVIPIEGTLVHKGAFVGESSGETSYQGLQVQVARALRSDAIKGVVFEIDSYGGEAAGAFDTADAIAELSRVKPTLAVITDVALSGGYLLGAAARQIVAPPFGSAGSIGVLRMHVDRSRALANAGFTVTLIAAGARKAEGNTFEPLPAEVAQRLQAEAEAMRGVFAERVGAYRGPRFTAAAAMATEAAAFGADEALALGLVDAIGKPAAAFDAFVAEINRKR